MRRRVVPCVLSVLVLAGCSSQLGRDVPECEPLITNSVIMEIQAVPSAQLVPCINALEVGWEYNHLEPRSGLAEFSIDSDRIGEPFLRVRTTETCDLGDAGLVRSDEESAALYESVMADLDVQVVVIPEGEGEAATDVARSIVVDLVQERFNDREVHASVDLGETTVSERIRAARQAGAHVIVISPRDAEEGTVSLLLRGEEGEVSGTRRQALDAIEDATPPATYRGSWFYVFEGGCTEYRFDAKGPGLDTIVRDTQISLGFTDTGEVKELARGAGYHIP